MNYSGTVPKHSSNIPYLQSILYRTTEILCPAG